MAHDIDTVLGWRGENVIDRDGEKIGSLKELYLDSDERPAWGSVHTGLFGMRQTFVPLAEAREVDGGIQLPFAKEHVNDAPSIDPDAQLSDDEERRLYDHYGIGADDEPVAGPDEPVAASEEPVAGTEAPVAADGEREPQDAQREERPAGETDDAMTRSEEELVVGTRRKVRGKARLKKYVVTEHVQRTIPVQREEVRVEYEPAEGEDGERAEDVSRDRAE